MMTAADARKEFQANVLTADLVVGLNLPYDFLVMIEDAARRERNGAEPPGTWRKLMRAVFELYDNDRVHDTMIAQMLGAIGLGQLDQDPRGGPLRDPVTRKEAGYRMSVVHHQCTGKVDAKVNDFWRLRYAILSQVPVSEWPADAKQYPVDDVCNALEDALIQRNGGGNGDTPGPIENSHLLADQCRAAWALHLTSAHGLRTNRESVAALKERATKEHEDAISRFAKVGFFKPDGKEDRTVIKRAVATAYGASGTCPTCKGTGRVLNAKGQERATAGGRILDSHWIGCKGHEGCDGTGLDLSTAPNLVRTPTGGVSADRDAKEESGDDTLMEFGELDGKLLGTYIPFLEKGTEGPVTLWPNPILDTLRASYRGVIQLLPRKGGVRECFEAREGWVFFSIDYAGLEMVTNAQNCLDMFGYSEMANVLNSDKDAHSVLGAKLLGTTYDDFYHRYKVLKEKSYVDARQASKPGNFGLAGGMGPAKFVLTQRKANAGSTTGPDGTEYAGIRFCILLGGSTRCGTVKITEHNGRPCPPLCKECVDLVAHTLKPAWLETFPEMREYFRRIGDEVERNNGEMVLPGVGLKRANLTFTSAANGPFQTRAAVGAKRALYNVVKETYLDEMSDMYGSRVSIFVHDELFGEMPWEAAQALGLPDASRAAPRMAQVMVETMRELCPDVKVKAEPALARRWWKAMEPVYRDGKLVPWEPGR
jgi:hypothetical protein